MNKVAAFDLLKSLNAPEHLVTHVTLVGEAASKIIECLGAHKLDFDASFVEVGVVLHDVGKIRHTQEMHQKGSMHEAEGEKILLGLGVDSKLARVCVTHGQWSNGGVSLEELLIALADKLWKGKRVQELEEQVIALVASSINAEYWELFTELDGCFESIASDGDERLSRSVLS